MSNLNALKKSELIALVEGLERDVEHGRRALGMAMYENNIALQRIVELENKVEDLETKVEGLEAEVEDIADLEAALAKLESGVGVKVSAPVSPVVKAAPKAVLAPAVVESSPVIEITDYDRDMWSKFKSLDRTTRLAIIEFARPEFGHVGIHNIGQIRYAWHSAQEISA